MKNFKFKIRGNQYNVGIQNIEGNEVTMEVNGTPYNVTIEREVKATKTPTIVRKKLPDTKHNPVSNSLKIIKAPLPGNIFKINISEGDSVKKGDVVLIMEAMKMENNIMAESDGVVKSIKVKEGDAVLQNDVIVEIA